MSAYPKNLQYLVKKISNYSRQTKRLSTLNATTASNSGVITVDLPSNSLVDLHTLVMSFSATTTAASLPRNIESLIQNVSVEINGQVISGCSYYNHLWNIIADTSMSNDCINRRKILQNATDVTASAAVTTAISFAISNWLTLNSFVPSICDTKILGNVRMRIQLDSGAVLAGAVGTFSLSNISFSVDIIGIDDGLYDASHAAFLASGGVYDIAFKNYFSFSGSASSYSQSTKFSISSQSLNRVWGTFLNQSPDSTIDTVAKNSNYFTRVATGLSTAQFNINGAYYPDYRASPDQCFYLTQASYNMLQDVQGGIHPNCSSLTAWQNNFFVFSTKFCHDDTDFISGIDTRGNSSIGSFDTQAVSGAPGTANLTALVFLECSSVIRVGAGRQLELVI